MKPEEHIMTDHEEQAHDARVFWRGFTHGLIVAASVVLATFLLGAGRADAAVTIGDAQEDNNNTTLTLQVDQANQVITMQYTGSGTCDYSGTAMTKYDQENGLGNAYPAELWYIEDPQIGSNAITCTSSGGMRAVAWLGTGALTFQGLGKQTNPNTTDDNIVVTPTASAVVVGVSAFGQNTWSCGSNCTVAIGGTSNRGGVWYTGVTAGETVTIHQNISDEINSVWGEIDESGGPPPPTPGSGGATSTIEQAQTNLFYAVTLFLAAFFGVIWLMRKH